MLDYLRLILFFAVAIINFIYGIFSKRSSFVLLLSLMSLSFIAGFSAISDNSDMSLYSAYYNGLLTYNPNWAFSFVLIEDLFSRIGFSFNMFRTIIYFICFLLLFFGCRHYLPNYHIIIVVYCFSLYVFLSITFRYFIAFSIVIFAIQFLIRSKRRPLFFVLLVLLATSFHTSVIFFLLLIVLAFKNKIKNGLQKMLFILDLIGLMISVGYYFVPSLYIFAISSFNSVSRTLFPSVSFYVDKYFMYTGNIMSPLYSISIFMFMMCFFTFVIKSKQSMDIDDKRAIDSFWLIMLICGIHFYTIAFALEMIRLFFVGLMMIFVGFSICFTNKKGRHFITGNRRFVLSLSLIICLAFWFYSIYGRHIYGYDLFRLIGGSSIS